MKFRFSIIALISVIAFCSCTGYNKLLKSADTEAKYAEGVRLYHAKKYHKATALFESIMSAIMGTQREDTMLFYIGKSQYNVRDYEMAKSTFDAYRTRFTRSAFAEEAEYLYAMCYYHSSLPTENDQANTRSAIIAFNEYMNRYPESIQVPYIEDLIDELTDKLYYKTYLNAAIYHKLGHYNASITSLRSALKEQPEIPYRQEMMFLIVKSWYDFARNSVFSRQLDRYMKMTDAYYNFKTEYPEAKPFDKELDKMLADAKEFISIYGVTAQEAKRAELSIENHRQIIENAKDQLFVVDTKKERLEYKDIIRKSRAAIKSERHNARLQAKEFKIEQKLLKSAGKNQNQAIIQDPEQEADANTQN